RELEHLLRPRRERDLPGGDLLAGADDADDLPANALNRDVEALEDAGRQALLLAQQSEQDVLGADVVVLERPRLFLRENHNLPGPLRESLEHLVLPSCSWRTLGVMVRIARPRGESKASGAALQFGARRQT